MVSGSRQQSQALYICDAPRTLGLPEVECSSLWARAQGRREKRVLVRLGKTRTAVELDGGDVCTATPMQLTTRNHTLKRI